MEPDCHICILKGAEVTILAMRKNISRIKNDSGRFASISGILLQSPQSCSRIGKRHFKQCFKNHNRCRSWNRMGSFFCVSLISGENKLVRIGRRFSGKCSDIGRRFSGKFSQLERFARDSLADKTDSVKNGIFFR